MPISANDYNKNQNFNFLTKWLHKFRYKHVLIEINSLKKDLDNRKLKVLDIGCGDSKLFGILNDKFEISYTGIELNEKFAKTAQKRFKNFNNFNIINGRVENYIDTFEDVDVITALETFEHIPEKNVVRIIEKIAKIDPKLLIISVPVEIGPAIALKNIGSLLSGYNRHKEYTWTETFWASIEKLDKIPVHKTGHKGFNWKWLAQTIRHNMHVKTIKKFPLNFLPPSLSSSIFMVMNKSLTKK